MTIEQSAVFLASTILTGLGIVIVGLVVIVLNNVLHKYWKPVKLFTPDSWKGFNPPVMQHEQTYNEPTLGTTK